MKICNCSNSVPDGITGDVCCRCGGDLSVKCQRCEELSEQLTEMTLVNANQGVEIAKLCEELNALKAKVNEALRILNNSEQMCVGNGVSRVIKMLEGE